MKLIITEKPSVATDFIKVLETNYEKKEGYYEGEEYVITWCIGHLITLCYPEAYGEEYKKWSFDTLPFIPDAYKYQVIPDERTKAQFRVVKTCLNRSDIDTIYYAGDSAREGEYIQRLVRQCAGHNAQAKEYRIWIDSQTEDEILRGIREAKPISEYDKMSDSGYMRAIEDYLLGINFSRALSIKYGQSFNGYIKSSKYVPISVGRVMTCVLGMIVDRERQIRDAVEIPFYGIKGTLENGLETKWKSTEESKYFESPLLFKDDAFKNENDASEFADKLIEKGTLTVETITKTTEKKGAPLLYSLAELQNECSKFFKISPDETLKVVQSLYDKKLTTYPRTDASVLSEAVAKEIYGNIKGLTDVSKIGEVAEKILEDGSYKNIKNTKYTNDAAISDHYAIIPTGHTKVLSRLDEMESNVYSLICKRFLSIFCPPAIYAKSSVVLKSGQESFFVSSKVLNEKGYLELYEIEEDDLEEDSVYTLIGSLKEGEEIRTDFAISKGTTTAPKRFTSGSIITAMKNAGNTVEDEELRNLIKSSGIGTSATRAETVVKLVKNGYIILDKKTQILKPSASGEILYEIVKASLPSLLSINMTASWEKGLTQIVDGIVTKQEYNNKMNSYIITEMEKIKNGNVMEQIEDKIKLLRKIYSNIGSGEFSNNSNSNETDFKCPCCKKAIIKHQWGYGCSGYKDGCKFAIGKNIFGATNLKDSQIEKLLQTGKVKHITFMSKEKNKKYEASLKLDQETGKISLMFDSKK